MVESGRKWGILMFMGEFRHAIDEKKRLIIPSKYREEIGSSFILTRGIDKCLFLYSQEEWNTLTAKLHKLSFAKKDARNFLRFFLSGATNLEFDKQGRVVLPSNLLEYAEITKDCVIVGVGERLEIWAKEAWDKFYLENADDLSDIAERLFDSDIEV